MNTLVHRADERGSKDIGWLKSRFNFSFSDFCSPIKSAFGTLVAFNDDLVATGKGFGIHPHVNMEIISVLLQGKMNHKDSMGHSTVIEAGGVQLMSAGSGLYHEEYNVGDEEVNFLQIWIQPKLQNINPRYQSRSFPLESRKNELRTIVSSEEGATHCWINQNTKIALGYFDAGKQVHYALNKENKCVFIFCITGTINVAGETLHTRDAIGLWDTDTFTIECATDAEFITIETVVNQK